MITDTPSGSGSSPPAGGWSTAAMDGGSRRPLWRHSAWLALAIYAAYAIFVTWPLATDPGGLVAGTDVNGDLGGSIAEIGYAVAHHVFPFAPAVLHGLNAPQGLSQPWVDNLASLPGVATQYGLGYIFGAVAGAAVFAWLGLVLSGLSMFLLTRRLFGSVRRHCWPGSRSRSIPSRSSTSPTIRSTSTASCWSYVSGGCSSWRSARRGETPCSAGAPRRLRCGGRRTSS